jgi:hypothetical protein
MPFRSDKAMQNRTVGLLIEHGAGMGTWMDVETISYALNRRLLLRSTQGILWQVLLLCWSHGYRRKLESSRERTHFSIQPPPAAGCIGTRCLEGTVALAEEGIALEDWASKLEFLVFVGSVPSEISPGMCQSIADRTKRSGPSCAVLPAEDVVASALERHSNDSWHTLISTARELRHFAETWVRGPMEERLLMQLRSSSRNIHTSLAAIPFSAPNMIVRYTSDQSSTVPKKHGRESSPPSDLITFVSVLLGKSSCEFKAITQTCGILSEAKRIWAINSSIHVILAVAEEHASWAAQAVREVCSTTLRVEIRSLSCLRDLRVALTDSEVALFPVMCHTITSGIILRALHAGLPVVALNAWPANETVTHMHDGILVLSPQDMLAAVRELMATSAPAGMRTTLRTRLTAPQPGLLAARQFACALHVQHRMSRRKDTAPPRVLSIWPGSHELHRRTELFRSDALRRHGFDVRELTYGADLTPHILHADFVVAAKPRISDLKRIMAQTRLPTYVWTWDLIDYQGDASRRAWFEEAAQVATSAFLNEFGREEMWHRLGAKVHYVGDGTVFSGNRGPGRRPVYHTQADSGDQVAFVGSVNATDIWDKYRIGVLNGLREGGVQLAVYGPAGPWASANIVAKSELWAEDAARVEAAASVALSLSRMPSSEQDHSHSHSAASGSPRAAASSEPAQQWKYHISMYHSDRLLRLTAAGACVLSNAFRGLDLLLPSDSVAAVRDVRDPAAVVQAVKLLLKDSDRRLRMRVNAEEHTWRRHTWEDSVNVFLGFVAGSLIDVDPRDAIETNLYFGDCNVSRGDPRGTGESENFKDSHDAQARGYYERVGAQLLVHGHASESLVYLAFALEACPHRHELSKAAAVSAMYAGDIRASLRLWHLAHRLLGGWRRADLEKNKAVIANSDKRESRQFSEDMRRADSHSEALGLYKRSAGGWLARSVMSACAVHDTLPNQGHAGSRSARFSTRQKQGKAPASLANGERSEYDPTLNEPSACMFVNEILSYAAQMMASSKPGHPQASEQGHPQA